MRSASWLPRAWGVLALLAMLQACNAATYTRHAQDISQGWLFIRDPQSTKTPWDRSYDTTGWSPVDLPHSFNAIDGMDGGTYYRDLTWYRKTLDVPALYAPANGWRLWLMFEASSLVSTVYLNGQEIGVHGGAYTRFQFDVTNQLSVGTGNVVAVSVTNKVNFNVPPSSGDWTTYGGITRNVYLMAVRSLHFSTRDFGGPGVYWLTPNYGPNTTNAAVQLTAKLDNDSPNPVSAVVVFKILTAGNRLVATGQSEVVTLQPWVKMVEVTVTLTVASPRRWNGVKDPYLYKITASLQNAGGAQDTVDQISLPLGFRWFWVDDKLGFFLNGENYKLNGVNRHGDIDGKGSAINETDIRRDMGLLLDLGPTAVRSHFSFDELWYTLCDRNGIISWTELPLVNVVPSDPTNSQTQLKEMIQQLRHHPGILFWSVGNEVLGLASASVKPVNFLNNLVTVARAMESGRLIAYAHRRADGYGNMKIQVDVRGVNTYERDPGALTRNIAIPLDTLNKNVALSEWGAGGQIDQHGVGRRTATEESQSRAIEGLWPTLISQRFWWGTFLFTFADQGSDYRLWAVTRKGVGTAGTLTVDHKTKKDVYFYLRMMWRPTAPTLYITERRYNPHPQVTDIKVYCNLLRLRLYINGVQLLRAPSVSQGVIYTFPKVQLPYGNVSVKVTARYVDWKDRRWRYVDKIHWLVRPAPMVKAPTPVVKYQP